MCSVSNVSVRHARLMSSLVTPCERQKGAEDSRIVCVKVFHYYGRPIFFTYGSCVAFLLLTPAGASRDCVGRCTPASRITGLSRTKVQSFPPTLGILVKMLCGRPGGSNPAHSRLTNFWKTGSFFLSASPPPRISLGWLRKRQLTPNDVRLREYLRSGSCNVVTTLGVPRKDEFNKACQRVASCVDGSKKLSPPVDSLKYKAPVGTAKGNRR